MVFFFSPYPGMVNDRKIKGMFYYPMEVGHTTNRRVRLLINDHGPEGYWVWKCLIDYAYGTYGYYFPVTGDDVDLISADVCRRPPEAVWAIIESTVKRGLFDQPIFTKHSILTNDKMQLNFIRGTFDRRRKGGIIYFEEKHFLLAANELHGIGEQYLDKVIFKDTGQTLRQKIDAGCGINLFSSGADNISTGKTNLTPENSKIPLLKRKRKINKRVSTNVLTSDDVREKEQQVGIKNEEETRGLAEKKDKRPARKKKDKGRNPDAEPYWSSLRRVWVDFNLRHLKFKVEPIPKADYSHLHRIVENIRERATGQAVAWTEQEAVTRLEKFFTIAYTGDQWLHDNFELAALESRRNTVFKLVENGRSETYKGLNGNKPDKQLGTSDARINAAKNW